MKLNKIQNFNNEPIEGPALCQQLNQHFTRNFVSIVSRFWIYFFRKCVMKWDSKNLFNIFFSSSFPRIRVLQWVHENWMKKIEIFSTLCFIPNELNDSSLNYLSFQVGSNDTRYSRKSTLPSRLHFSRRIRSYIFPNNASSNSYNYIHLPPSLHFLFFFFSIF